MAAKILTRRQWNRWAELWKKHERGTLSRNPFEEVEFRDLRSKVFRQHGYERLSR